MVLGIWILSVCFLFGTFSLLEESFLGCVLWQLLNADQSLQMPVSPDTMPFQKDFIFFLNLCILSRFWYVVLPLSFGRIAFECCYVVHISCFLFQRAMLIPTKRTKCHRELKCQFLWYIWILTLTLEKKKKLDLL